MPMGNMTMPMLPGMASYVPPLTPFLPGMGVDINTLPMVQPREVHELTDGDTLALDARLVRKAINGRSFVMYGFNGQHPGPLIRVREQVTIVIVFTNHLDLPTTVHWHGRSRSSSCSRTISTFRPRFTGTDYGWTTGLMAFRV
jgi:FtsP/CotA-like multicopper oxidase with cupredoxin domain